MADSKKLEKEFQELKTAISNYYRGERYKWLRCCLYGIVPGSELDKTEVGAALFNVLHSQGYISPTNVGLLSEITELTSIKDAIDCVNKYKHDNKVEDSVVKKLTSYRRGLVKVLMGAGKGELMNVVCNYSELMSFNFNNLWDAVLKLERSRLLEDDPEKIERFLNLLEEDTKALFLAGSGPSVHQQASSSGATRTPFPATQETDVTDSAPNSDLPPMELMKLAGELGHEWKSLGICLGHTNANIDQITIDNPHNVQTAIFNMLDKWQKSVEGTNKTRRSQLADALRKTKRTDLAEKVELGTLD